MGVANDKDLSLSDYLVKKDCPLTIKTNMAAPLLIMQPGWVTATLWKS
ncbi:hypothetical protein KRR40_18965 [Niabella defluvii]|nr:hypothetical protein KRR40_18965 [Niabella sp. I65]